MSTAQLVNAVTSWSRTQYYGALRDAELKLRIDDAHAEPNLSAVRTLFLEYAASLPGIDLEYQNFDEEFAALPGFYAPPSGALLLASVAGDPAGCVGLHAWEPGISEMKRLYLKPAFRGQGVGRALVVAVMDRARSLGYGSIRLDTLPTMLEAQELYRRLGFREIGPYRASAIPGTKYFEAKLDGRWGRVDVPQVRAELPARHAFRLEGPDDMTPELVGLLREAFSRAAVNRSGRPDVRGLK